MAIDLLNSFLQKGQNVSTNSKSTSPGNAQNIPQNLQVMRAIRALQAGATLRGEIISVKGEEVALSIFNDVIIDAKLAGSMNLIPGTSMSFQVKANNQNGLSLIPLFTNTAADPNVMKALDMAGLPMNERSIEMVQALMEKGMPIDKQALQEAYRDVAGFKDYPVGDIVSLRQLQMPVNTENLNQLSAYENNNHYLSDSFSDVGKALANHLVDLIKEGNTGEAKQLVVQLQHLFDSQGKGIENKADNANAAPMQGEAGAVSKETIGTDGTAASKAETGKVIIAEDVVKEINAEQKILSDEKMISSKEPQGDQGDIIKENPVNKEALENAKSQTPAGEKPVIEWKDVLQKLEGGKDTSKFAKLFEKVWNKEIADHWMLDAETTFDKKQVKEFYERMDSGIKELEKLLGETANIKSPVAKVVQNVSSNLDFMNQLHQIHAYIQLPLKMSGKNTHGELYVFTNKKNLTKQEGKVTALLHLDMEHLGKMDVYVALENNKVSTNFYLEKEEYLDFLEANMDLLNSRLQNRGYECDIKASVRGEQEESVMKIIEKQQGQGVLLSTQAFDVRA